MKFTKSETTYKDQIAHYLIDTQATSFRWVKFGNLDKVVFVGKVAVTFGQGCYLVFINLETGNSSLYAANLPEKGLGVRCYVGHRINPIFAFSESDCSPNIYIHTYPEFNLIHKLAGDSFMGYTSMIFTEDCLLIALDDLPSCCLTVWNWRTGEKMATIKTDIQTEEQILKTSLGKPPNLIQIEKGTTRANVWYLLMCGNKCMVTEQKVNTRKDIAAFSAALWSADGAFFILDVCGNVYIVNQEMDLVPIIQFNEKGNEKTSFTWFKGGLFIAGPNCQIRHYKRDGKWNENWRSELPEAIENVTSNYRDHLVACTVRGNILLFDNEKWTFKYIKIYETKFNDFCLIHPLGKYMVTLAQNKQLTSWEIANGTIKDNVDLKSTALTVASNPEYPYVGIGYSDGILQLFSLYKPNKISSMVTFRLTRNAINSVYFTEISKLIVAADTLNGQFFIIEGVPGSQMNVVGTVDFRKQIADYILVASKTCYRLFTLPVTSSSFLCGNKIFRHCIIKDKEHAELKEFQLDDSTQMYSKLYATTKPNRDRVFYAIPFKSKMIHVIETKRGDPKARVIQKINTGHQINKFFLSIHKSATLSYGYDGLLMIRDPNSHEPTDIIMPHHRRMGGILRAYVTPNKKYVLTLGRENNLVCTALDYVVVDAEKDEELEKTYSEKFVNMFSRRTIGFVDSGTDITWLELVAERIKEEERKSCYRERSYILWEFKAIQDEVQELLTKNLEGPENEVLDMQKFNLDTEYAEEQKLWAGVRCKHTKIYLEALIVAQDNVTKWCKKYFWDRMSVQGKSICAICDNLDIQNYVMFPSEGKENVLKIIGEKRRIEDLMAKLDSFQPWIPQSNRDLLTKLSQSPQLAKPDGGPTLALNLEDEDEEKEKEVNIDQEIAKNGSVACNYVELNPWHYTQEERHTFYQRSIESILTLEENNKLKIYFNNKFDALHSLKVREIHNIKERYARLRHIISEINFFSIFKIHIDIRDPEWKQEENPETIITVNDKEVGITPYVSPSMQARLDAKAAEEERIRLLLLADDFRERALMAMMNGVLEVRWEDELKKDVSFPKCMLEKHPDEYVEEDLRAVRDYEEKVKFLQSEREKYINMLYAEYYKLSNITRENMRKFNTRLAEASVMKLEVQTGISQQHLQVHRIRHNNHTKNLIAERIAYLENNARLNDEDLEATQKMASQIYQYLQECRNNTEQLLTMDKTLEKAFKKEYAEQSTTIQEMTLKMYKKRPKITTKNINDSGVLIELARCLINQEKTYLASLNKDSIDFLKAMDGLDAYIGVPSVIDEKMYNNVCKHRRLKVENEIKIRAASIYTSDGEQALAKVKARLVLKKGLANKILDEIAHIRQNKLKMEENIEIQLALRQAYVEIPTTGSLTDFDDAILVCRNVVEDINKIIVKIGNRKLAAMRETMSYRRQILLMEWKHQELKMIIEDIEQQLKDIDSVRVTKEIRQFLDSKARNQVGDSTLPFDQQVDIIKESYERTLDEKRARVRDLQKQIIAIKKENKKLDLQIEDINVDICEFKIVKDENLSITEAYILKERMAILIKRAKLVKQIQENHNELLVKQTELELLRLKTYPTLKYKILT